MTAKNVATSPRALLDTARTLWRRPVAATTGCWSRASALLARQALEGALDEYWSVRQPGIAECRAQRPKLLCLPTYADHDFAAHAYHTWTALSHACHITSYELDPTAVELEALMDNVEEVIERSTTGSEM